MPGSSSTRSSRTRTPCHGVRPPGPWPSSLRSLSGRATDNGQVNLFVDHPRARWALPAGAVVLIAAGSLVASRTASADSGLAPRTAAQLLVDVQQSATRQLSGTVVQTAHLGLPDVTALTGQ